MTFLEVNPWPYICMLQVLQPKHEADGSYRERLGNEVNVRCGDGALTGRWASNDLERGWQIMAQKPNPAQHTACFCK